MKRLVPLLLAWATAAWAQDGGTVLLPGASRGGSGNSLVVGLLLAVVLAAAIVWLARRSGQRPPPVPPRASPHGSAPAASPAPAGRSVFISYRRGDSADITGRIYDRLVQHFGRECVYKDVDSIPLGIDFREHLERAVGRCHVLLAIVGRGWLEAGAESGQRRLDDSADFLRIEVETALRRNVPVIPVLVQGATMPLEQTLPATLRAFAYRNGVAVRTDPDFHGDVDRLIAGIEAHFRVV